LVVTTIPVLPETVEAGDGVRLEVLGPERAADVAEAINASLDHLRPWMDWAHRPTTTQEQAVRLALAQERFRVGGDATWTVVDATTGDVVGGCGLHHRAGPGVLDIGYWLRPEATGKGYATAAAAALARVAFDTCGADLVRITCAVANARSAAVAERLGFDHTHTVDGSMVWELAREDRR
jgi:RimJ/RimL family protein N-acetyltransferase